MEDPLNNCTETPTPTALEQAITHIASNSENDPATEEHMQTVVDFVFSHLIAESSINSIHSMKYEYARKLKYKSCKGDEYLPTNFNSSSAGEADAVVLVVLENRKKFPILVGELKAKVNIRGTKSDYVQLFNYMLTVQRPYIVDDNRSHLIGFLMDFDEAFTYRLKVGFWTDCSIVPSIAQFILPIIYQIHL